MPDGSDALHIVSIPLVILASKVPIFKNLYQMEEVSTTCPTTKDLKQGETAFFRWLYFWMTAPMIAS
eukprot:13576647-Ditylum_brightwellii.AAC.1